MCAEEMSFKDRISLLLDDYPDLLARKDLDRIGRETNIPVSRSLLYSPPKGLEITTIGSRKLLWKDALVRYLVQQTQKPL